MKQHIQKYQEIIVLCLISLLVRLIIMPYAQSTDADATSRVFLARELMDNFRLIMSGHWAPIHHYFNALSLLIIPDNAYGPKVLSILFAVASCIPLYFFTKNEFNKQGAIFVTLIYTFSPVVFKNSFLAMAEVSYAFFILLSLYFLSNGIRLQQKTKYAIYAGLSITIAGGIRYEAWEVMGLFFIVLVLFKQWKMLIPFGLTALIFPVYWMIGNQIQNNDFLYSFHYGTNWIDNIAGYNDNLTKAEYVKRLLFFPISWGLMLTPFITIILIITFFKKLFTKKISRRILIWLIPFLGVLFTYMYSAYKGTLYTQHRFTITLVLFSVPFFAIYFENEKHLKLKKVISYSLIALMIPLSFYWQKIPFNKLSKISYTLSYVLENSIKDDEAIPLINDESTEAISSSINYQLTEKKGLVLDFVGWDKTYYIALNSRASYKNIFLIEGTLNGKVYVDVLNNFIKEHPEGLIMIKAYSELDNICHSVGSLMEIENIPVGFYLEKCLDINNIKLFRYYTKSKEWSAKYKSENAIAEGITKTTKNIEFYENAIRSDLPWLKDVEAKAKTRNLSIDEMISIDAQWMVDQDLINSKKDSIKKQN